MTAPPGSPAAFADQIGSTYQWVEAANGLSTGLPPLELVPLPDDELELEDDELLLLELELELEEELLDEELLDEELLELDELLDEVSPPTTP
jgi:hypothetical protein